MAIAAEKLSPDARYLTLHVHGCHVIQKALQVFPLTSREKLIEGLKHGTVECIKSKHGNHVIQACIKGMPPTSFLFIIDAIECWGAGNASAHVYASRVVTNLLENAAAGQMRNTLCQIFQSVSKLSQ